jgi:methenyltetrahydrofolate cyclohydrolase
VTFADQPIQEFLDRLADRTPTPGGGGAAALTAALAAGLVAMAARFSVAQLPEAGDLAARADELRRRAAELADIDARAYQAVLDARRLPADADADDGQRQVRMREALLGAAAVPLEISEIGARVAELARRVAEAGNPNLRGDAVTGAVLAAAAARSAACLVDINVGLGGLEPELSRRAAQAVTAADRAADPVAADRAAR